MHTVATVLRPAVESLHITDANDGAVALGGKSEEKGSSRKGRAAALLGAQRDCSAALACSMASDH